MTMEDRTRAITAILGTDATGGLIWRRTRVSVVTGRDRGANATLERASLIVGSDPQCHLRIGDPNVARCHAELSSVGEGIRLRDLGSQSGTFVGAARVHSTVLPKGAQFRVGATSIELIGDDEPIAIEPIEGCRMGALLGRSLVMRRLFAVLSRIAEVRSPVLVVGEPGVGKTAIAVALHEALGDKTVPFVFDVRHRPSMQSVSAALGETGATVVLEHIDELRPDGTRALRAILEERERTGHKARLISTARNDLRGLVERDEFPLELYFSVASLRVPVPSLRERVEDVALLAQHFAAGRAIPAAELASLEERGFPGNVRELRAAIDRQG